MPTTPTMPATQIDIETVLDAHATIGEAPTWVAEEKALYWIDVKAPALYRLGPGERQPEQWLLPGDIGGFALFEYNAALVALRTGIHRLDLASGKVEMLAPSPFDPALFRFNEGACDSAGRFWVGVMFDPLEGSPPEQPGRLHSFTVAGGLRAEPDAAELHNGMAWSADDKTFYLSHSNSGKILAFDYDVAGGRLTNKRVFATIDPDDGIPDGAAIDTDGGYWCALHGGSKLRRLRPDGSTDFDVSLPVSQPTMCAFAGEALDTLYLTSASDKMSEADKAKEPLAGALMRLRPGTRGIERYCLVR